MRASQLHCKALHTRSRKREGYYGCCGGRYLIERRLSTRCGNSLRKRSHFTNPLFIGIIFRNYPTRNKRSSCCNYEHRTLHQGAGDIQRTRRYCFGAEVSRAK